MEASDGMARQLPRLVPAIFAALALCAFGLAFIYSTGYIGDDYPVRENWMRQAFFMVAGAVACIFAARTDYGGRFFRIAVASGYAASLAALVLVLVAGHSSGGATRWLAVGGITIQPAEFAKVFTVLACAYLLSDVRRGLTAAAAVVGATALPCVLIIVEPSYGNAFSLVVPVAAMMVARWSSRMGMAAVLALALACIALAFCGLLWIRSTGGTAFFDRVAAHSSFGLRDYHLRRVRSYADPHGGWNERQSIVTLASGGPYGKGYLQGTMKGLGFLPRTVAPSDFIFAVIGEELGFWYGCMPVMLLYALLFFSTLRWGGTARDSIGGMVCLGGTALLFTHVAVNVGMVVRLLPVIGLPLPLLSYGGSYVMATLLLLGAMASIPLHSTKNADDCGDGTVSVFSLGRLFAITVKDVSRR